MIWPKLCSLRNDLQKFIKKDPDLFLIICFVAIGSIALLISLGASAYQIGSYLGYFPSVAHIWSPLPTLMLNSPIAVLVSIHLGFLILYLGSFCLNNN